MLQTKINQDLISSIKAGNKVALGVLRQLKTSISEFAARNGNVNDKVSDLEILSIIRKRIKQGEDSIEQFNKANRGDLVAKEVFELDVLREYLPEPINETELDKLIQEAIWESGAVDKKGMGKAIKKAMELTEGRVENKVISQKVAEFLEKGVDEKPKEIKLSVEAKVAKLFTSSDQDLKLMFGELTAQEIRTLRSAFNYLAT